MKWNNIKEIVPIDGEIVGVTHWMYPPPAPGTFLKDKE